MFAAQAQKYYFDFYGIEYNNLYITGDSVETYALTAEPVDYDYPDYKSLIHICENSKLNGIGEAENSLSKAWYQRNRNNVLIRTLKNDTGNFFKNYMKTKTRENLWTTFKDYQKAISGKGYAKGFLSCNMRATNEYRDRVAVAYLINKFFNPNVKHFFAENGIEVDEDAYALSEMVQFVWRSAVREGGEIWLYAPSKRMRLLFRAFLNDIRKK